MPIVEQVNVDPVPNWQARDPIVDQACDDHPPCVRVGCTVRSDERAPVEADVRFVLELQPVPLDEVQPVQLAAGERKVVVAEFPGAELDRGQTFGRCEIVGAGTTVTCWVKNPGLTAARFDLVARLTDAGAEQRGTFELAAGESRPIPFRFDQRGRVGRCELD